MVTISTLPRVTTRTRALGGARVAGPVLVGLVAFLVSFAGAWVAPAGIDEAATMSAARRSLPDLWRMAHHVDGVHSTYYALAHLWLQLVPYELWTLRLPSAVAVGVGAALLVLLVRRLADARVALVAGLVFAVLPRVTSSGLQGRSYALSMTVAIAATLLFVIATARSDARRRSAWGWWAAYALTGALSGYVFLYSALLLVAHGCTVLVRLVARRRASLRAALSWLAAAVVAGALVVPLVLVTSGQTEQQLYWIGTRFRFDASFWNGVLVQQEFGRSVGMAIVCGALAVVGTVATIVVPALRARRELLALALPAVVVPVAVVVAVSVLVQPYYNARYLTFTAPFAAVLIALGITAVRWRVTAVVGVVLVAALAAPSFLQQRAPTGKTGTEWVHVTHYLEQQRARERDPGSDGVYFGPLPRHAVRTTEYLRQVYPDAFRGMRDVTLVRSASSIGQLWAERLPAHQVPFVRGLDRVWFVGGQTSEQPAAVRAALERAGWEQEQHHRVDQYWVISFVRR